MALPKVAGAQIASSTRLTIQSWGQAFRTHDLQLRVTQSVLLAETEGYWPEFRSALEHGRISGPQVHDARLIAICRHQGVRQLWTSDRDFSRFPQLTVINPLAG